MRHAKVLGRDNLLVNKRIRRTPIKNYTIVTCEGSELLVAQTWYEYIKSKIRNSLRLRKYKS